jgi:cellulose biosynthesis protein BcsQ
MARAPREAADRKPPADVRSRGSVRDPAIFAAVTPPSPEAPGLEARPRRLHVLAVSSNKGGVGKTTLATNLAVYMRAMHEDLPVAVVGLDDQQVIDRMFALRPQGPADGNLKHGWAERSLDRVLQLGEYGVHFVPSPPDVTLLKARAESPTTLARIIGNTDWHGILILDTKSDLEALTRNAYHAAERILVPVADRSSLEEAGKTLRTLERERIGSERARIVFTLVDRRTRVDGADPVLERLSEEVDARGWLHYGTTISRSPRVEALNSGDARPRSILHHARGTAVHGELRRLAEEILDDLAELAAAAGSERAAGGEPAALWGPRLASRPEIARVRPSSWLDALRGR